jgi:hypothetical protein
MPTVLCLKTQMTTLHFSNLSILLEGGLKQKLTYWRYIHTMQTYLYIIHAYSYKGKAYIINFKIYKIVTNDCMRSQSFNCFRL